ncbi:MAG: AraC family transcriptional regulator [Prevotella sp.]|nr:AraC family transcriptional regulator [Prevotella sp.]MBR6495393.1 AraC family transcriptional regulator [Prevotella sp.]
MMKNHPIEVMSAEIEKRGLVVIENVTGMPIDKEPYASPHLVISLCHRGMMKGKYDMHGFEFRPHDIAAIYPNHVIVSKETSCDFQNTLVVISAKLFEKFRQDYSFRVHFEIQMMPAFHLTEEQYECVVNVFNTLRMLSDIDDPAQTDLLVTEIHVLSKLLILYKQLNSDNEPQGSTSGKQLMPRFYDALVENFRKSREVSFYADLLGLSPKYFGAIIRNETGVGAVEWISRYVITQAKTMLRSRRDLTIQQISNDLGFINQTIFSHYFRNHAGVSPRNYRKDNGLE